MDHSPAHDLLMNVAAGLLVGGGAVFIALSALAGRRGGPGLPASPAPDARSLRITLAVTFALASGVIHLAAAPAHIDELGALGWGFVGATVFQASWALAYLIAPTRPVALWGIAGSLAIALAWLWSRTVGLPIGPAAGTPEAIALPDAVATLFEVLLITLLAAQVAGVPRPWPRLVERVRSVSVIAAIPAVGLVVVVTSMAVTLALTHSHAPGEGHAKSPASLTDPGH